MSNPNIFIVKKLALVAALLGMSLLWTGCRTTGEHINWYQGPQRATNEVALIKFPRSFPDEGGNVFISNIDGTNISKGFVFNNTREAELLPGMHTLELYFTCQFGDQTMFSLSNCVISFNCQGGHVYDAYMSPVPNSEKFRNNFHLGGETFDLATWIIDEQTEEVVAGQRFTKYFFTDSSLTSLESVQKEKEGHRTTSPTFEPQDVVIFDVNVLVDDPVKKLDMRNVVFRWYAGSNLTTNNSSNEQCSLSFDGKSNNLRLQRKASTLGLGHFKVVALIEGEEVASQEFDVSP